MTPPLDFEAAKQKVAESYQYEDWVTATAGRKANGAAMDRLIREVSQLLAKSWANHYVNEDRKLATTVSYYNDEADGGVLTLRALNNRPLPFPEYSPEKNTRTCIKCGKTLPEEEFYEVHNATGSIRTDCKKCNISTALSREKRLRETDPVWLEKERKRQVEKVKRYRQAKKKS